ncbi:AraC family transcriptional regulator [Sphingobium amiense]|uniref:AraC family transcriptional regulator n=1 Tax=Sphingobium amiense TaxID=135719 RepID=A0A494WFF4_9SPHN|nr:AraC family transcriptional regulator [Sphingobium amiense]BBD99642.1 AraC family transcriptional regulator [Sphingobium amiense]
MLLYLLPRFDNPMTRPITDRCSFPSTLWRAIRVVGIDPAAVLHKAGLPGSVHLDPATSLSTSQYFAIWKAINALADEPCIALKIIRAGDTTGQQPGFLAGLYAANFRDAISRLLHFKSMVTSEKIWTKEEQGRWSMGRDWPFATEREPSLSIDLAFAYMVELGRRGTGQRVRPVRVQYARDRGRDDALESYYGCRIDFGAGCDSITFANEDLDIPFSGYSPEFLEIVTHSVLGAFAKLAGDDTVIDRVKSAMKRTMGAGRPEAAAIASELGMSERTLQRRITSEASTYRALLIEARRERGLELLQNPSFDIDAITTMLGYESSTSFYRAFKQWEGVSPGEWRLRRGMDRGI